MRRNKLLILASIILLLSWPTFLKAQSKSEQLAEETRYTNESIGRVTLVEGKSFIQRAAEVGYEEVVVNDPIAEGDKDRNSRGASGNIIWSEKLFEARYRDQDRCTQPAKKR